MSSTPAATKSDSIRIKFKTSKKNGVLLKTEFAYDYVTIKLSQGLVEVNWNLGSGQLQIFVQKKVHDNKWHDLSIKRSKRVVTVSLDKGNDVVGTTPPKLTTFNMHGGEGKVYIGGDGESSKQFVGCLRLVMFNGVELISKLKRKDPLVKLSVRGNAMWNCPVVTTTAMPTTLVFPSIATSTSLRHFDERRPTKQTTERHIKSTRKATKSIKTTTNFRKTTQCSPNDIMCVLATFPTTEQPPKTLLKQAKSTEESSKDLRTDYNIITDKGGNKVLTDKAGNGTSTAKTPKVEGLKDEKDLGNVPTAIGLVAGSIVLFVVCAVISIKLKKMRDKKSPQTHHITIEEREVDEMLHSKVYQPDSYENKS